MSDERNPSQQSMRRALAEVMPPDHPVLHLPVQPMIAVRAFGCLAKSSRIFPCSRLSAPMTEMPSMWTTLTSFFREVLILLFRLSTPSLMLRPFLASIAMMTMAPSPIMTFPSPLVILPLLPPEIHLNKSATRMNWWIPFQEGLPTLRSWPMKRGASTNSWMIQQTSQCIYSVSCRFAASQERDASATWSTIFPHVAPPAMSKTKATSPLPITIDSSARNALILWLWMLGFATSRLTSRLNPSSWTWKEIARFIFPFGMTTVIFFSARFFLEINHAGK